MSVWSEITENRQLKKNNKIDGTEKQAKQNKEKQPILQVTRVHQNRQPDQMSKYLHSDT